MSKHHHPHFPKTLVSYRDLPGENGTLDVIAESAHIARLQLTDEFVDLNRNDAQEMIRVLAAWLAAPVTRVIVDADGVEAVVVVEGERRGAEVVVVIENEGAEARSHVQASPNRPT
jgi:hypothetical protein